jgi:hypothetical protein
MRGAISVLPLYVFMEWCLVKHRDNFTFIIISYHRFPFFWHFSSWTSGAPPSLRLQVLDSSTFIIMCNVPSTFAFFYIYNLLLNVSRYCFQTYFFCPLVTIPMVSMITDMTKHFLFHIPWIYTLRFLYFNSLQASFCITFLSEGIAMPMNKQIFVLSLIIISALLVRTCLYLLSS